MLYSLTIYLLISITCILTIIDFEKGFDIKTKTTFTHEVSPYLCMSLLMVQIIAPIFSWAQIKQQQEYLNLWIQFQVSVFE